MSLPNGFTEENKQTVVDFLNMVALHAKFTLDTKDVIKYFKLLSQMQQVILPKIENHILEVKRIIKLEQESSKEE